MKAGGLGLGLGCLAFLVLWAVLAAGAYRVMANAALGYARPGLALASGFLLALGLLSFWYLARGFGQGEASRAEVLRRAAAAEVPSDGEPVVASGAVRSLGPALIAPLSGVECVAYFYSMYYMGRQMRSTRPMRVPVYWGHATRPFAIDAPATRFRVLAVPMLLDAPKRREGDAAVERARQWLAATRFEDVQIGLLGAVGTTLQLASTVFTDDDGEDRRDYRAAGDLRDPQTLCLEETVLPVGRVASISGTWSVERQAIVAGGEAAVGSSVSAVSGGPEKLRGGPGVLPHSFTSYVVTATILTALGAGLVWFSVAILPGLL